MKKLLILPLIAVAGLSLASCSDTPVPTEPDQSPVGVSGTPTFAISDAAHLGTVGFYFLPPVVPDPGATGTFDASFLPFTTVRICELGLTGCVTPALVEYTSTSGSGSETLRVTTDEELYIVNWHTDEFDLDPEKVYRIEVQVGPTVIGYADVDPVTSGNELKNVDTGEFIALKDGRTLPVKFRLENDLPGIEVIGSAGGTVTSGDGTVRLDFPPGAIGSGTVITIVSEQDAPAEQGTIPGALWTFGPDGIVFDEPVQLTVKYDPGALPEGLGDPLTALALGTRVEGLWEELPSSVDEDLREVTAPLAGFSSYALILKVHKIEIEPWPATLDLGSSELLTAIPQTASGDALTARWLVWGSSDSSIVDLDAESDGLPHTVLATGAALGEATIGVVGVIRGCPPSPFGAACEVAKRFANVTVVEPGSPPEAAFTYECTHLTCDFVDDSKDGGTIESWEWDFGDGSEKDHTQNPSHEYAAAGSYTVTLTVTDDDLATDDFGKNLDVVANIPPTAIFTRDCTDLGCDFFDESTDEDGTIESWHWDFGDGSEDSSQNPSHLYTSIGVYSVTLTVTDDDEDTHSLSKDVFWNPSNLPPVPAFRYACWQPLTRQAACAVISDSYDTDGSIVEYQWIIPGSNTYPCYPNLPDCEGGGVSFAVDVAPTTATLIVTDDSGSKTSITRNLTMGFSFGSVWVWPSDFGVDPPIYHPFSVGDVSYYPGDGVEISFHLAQQPWAGPPPHSVIPPTRGPAIYGTVSYNGQECDVSGYVESYGPGDFTHSDGSTGLLSANGGGCQFGWVDFETIMMWGGGTLGPERIQVRFFDSAGEVVAEGFLRRLGP